MHRETTYGLNRPKPEINGNGDVDITTLELFDTISGRKVYQDQYGNLATKSGTPIVLDTNGQIAQIGGVSFAQSYGRRSKCDQM